MRQKLIWMAIIAGAAFYILAFLIGDNSPLGQRMQLTTVRTGLSTSINVVGTMAFGVGFVSLFMVHGLNIARRRQGWPYSIIVFVTFGLVVVLLGWDYNVRAHGREVADRARPAVAAYQAVCEIPDPDARDAAMAALPAEQLAHVRAYYAHQRTYAFQPRAFYIEYVNNALAKTVMALLGFYITYAAYRAFRIRSYEATVMMVAATVVILGSDALGGLLSVQLNALVGQEGLGLVNLPGWADFFDRVLNGGMQRGLMIGIGVATIAAALRILLGYERGLTEVRTSGE